MFNKITQVAMPVLTITAQVAVAMKYPQWSLVINLIAQPFWLYSAWKSYKQAGQIGFLISAILLTFIMIFGIYNYRLSF
jgi:hypothetical protein